MGRRLSGGVGLCMRIELFQSLLQLSHGLQEFGQLGECSDGAQPFVGGERGGTGDAGAGRYIGAETALGIHDRAFVHSEVPGGTGLAREQNVALEYSTAGKSSLGADDII